MKSVVRVNSLATSLFQTVTLICSFVFLISCKPQGGPPQGMAVKVVVKDSTRETLIDSVSAVGTIVANEEVILQSEVDGIIENVGFVEGQSVEVGKVLFKIDEKKLKASFLDAQASYKLASQNLKRSKDLLENKTISVQEHDQSQSNYQSAKAKFELEKRRLADATVAAPFSGIVGARLVSPGQFISRGQTLTSVVNIDPVKLEVNLPERYSSKVKPGQKIKVTVAAFADKEYSGEVYFVSPLVDKESRTVLVKALIPNQGTSLKPGMFASLELELESRDTIIVPEIAAVLSGTEVKIVVCDADSKAEFRTVTVGKRMPGSLEILQGLAEGEKIVLEGLQKIGPGTKLNCLTSSDKITTKNK